MATNHYYSVSREKGVLTFTDSATNRTYKFDINSGVFMSGATGKAVKSFPTGFVSFLSCYHGDESVVSLMNDCRNNPSNYGMRPKGYYLADPTELTKGAALFNLLDRVQSLPYKVKDLRSYRTFHALPYLADDFKTFVKYCQTTAEPTINDFFYGEGGLPFFVEKYNLSKYHLSNDDIAFLYNYYRTFGVENLPTIAYYLSRGLLDFFDNSYNARECLERLIAYCKGLDIALPREDFYRSYINIKRTYKMNKRKIDAAILAKTYDAKRDALTYENDRFTVVIPQTTDDFKAEGDAQHNCVYSMYLDKVLNGRTRVVFVRDKENPAKSLITCEVDNSGNIRQYLLRYNCHCEDAALNDFRNEYAAHIKTLWGD